MRFLIAGKHRQAMLEMERALARVRCGAELTTDGAKALDLCMEDAFDCLVLDASVLWADVVQTVCGIRDAGVYTPIFLLVEKGHRRLGIAALNAGADDFLLKPFPLEEFVARARALARRNGSFAPSVLTWGDLSLNSQTFEMRTEGGSAHLGNREYQIMELLMRGHGRPIPAEEIAGRVWGAESGATAEGVWVHICALRGKLRAIGAKTHIGTYRGQGYVLEE